MAQPGTVALTRPRAIPRGARIAALAPASPSDSTRIESAIENLSRQGFSCTVAGNAFSSHRAYLAGDDEIRADEINRMLRDESFDAFFVTRGGYGTMRLLDKLDFEAIARNPRPIVGFSDITALHQSVARITGVSTFHGPMLNLDWYDGLGDDKLRWLFSMLSGDSPLVHQFQPEQVVLEGTASGIVFGGCLSLTTALIGTPYDFWIDDGIWFWEDVDEPLYRIDRMLTHLGLSGRFESLQAVMIGKMKSTDGDEDRALFEALLRDVFGKRGIPVIKDLPFGHEGNNLLIPIGAPAIIDTRALSWTFPEPVVS